ncbi:cyclic nucleotide-binding domain-containing protein [Vibrio sp. SM6]|uniref:histidine kinase n=1 Tax=Vibrio agarilyticus TaxID=2726741 RepID=A0A7X8TMR2_9VIBR|nr:cyclic nucleotide-binding domain-containing protein [Vibrio agarilyticus]
MNRYALLYLDSNPLSLEQGRHELSAFTEHFDIFSADSLDEAEQAIAFLKQKEQTMALVIAAHHREFDGANFLISLDKNPHTEQARKILISDSVDIAVILNAVNEGRLDHCLTKPLQPKQLHLSAKKELTQFVLRYAKDELVRYCNVLEQDKLLKAHVEQQVQRYHAGFIHDYHRLSDNELAERCVTALSDFFDQKGDETRARRQYSANHLLTEEGTPNHFLWFITQGQVALYKRDDQNQLREVVRHNKGNIVGGMSFVTGEPSFSTALTLSPTEVIKLDRSTFAKVMQSDSNLLPIFTNLLLRHFNRRLQRSITTKLDLQKTLESLESAHQQLVEKEKMAMLGQLVAGVAHELNNPVAATLRSIDLLSTQIDALMCEDEQSDATRQVGIQCMQHASESKPLSTLELRSRAQKLLPRLNNPNQARKLVALGLDDQTDFIARLSKQTPHATEQLKTWDSYHQVGSALRTIKVCSQRIADMVKSLKSYARSEDEEGMREANIHEGLQDTLLIFENRLKRLTVHIDYADLPLIRCQPLALQQVWTNLISNALDAMNNQGEFRLYTQRREHLGQDYATVVFHDSGCGIPAPIQHAIFDLNFTTKREGNFGLGIGLSICQQIVHSHHGWIDVQSEEGQYTQMTVWLPIFEQGANHE